MRACLWLIRTLGVVYSVLLITIIVFPACFSILHSESDPESGFESSPTKPKQLGHLSSSAKNNREISKRSVGELGSEKYVEMGENSDSKGNAKLKKSQNKNKKKGKQNTNSKFKKIPNSKPPQKDENKNKHDKSSKIECDDNLNPKSWVGQRGSFWVLHNHVRATQSFACDESITFTTHADHSFLDNLLPLVDRWRGPVSLSLYTPGFDYSEAMRWIRHLRQCSPLVKQLVTFHLFFDGKHIPNVTNLLKPQLDLDLNNEEEDSTEEICSALFNFSSQMVPKNQSQGQGQIKVQTYRSKRKLLYPVNVARNIAREMATTHYVLAADVELYPNPNLIRNFLAMIKKGDPNLQRKKPKVFVVPVFEVDEKVQSLPSEKWQLLEMLHNKTAVPFHKYVCKTCHTIPGQDKWMKLNGNGHENSTHGQSQGQSRGQGQDLKNKNDENPLKIIHVGKRIKAFFSWEPFYIGTKMEPVWDERLSWEGRRNKMPQAYLMCVLDYDFMILDKAFLVHRPGIKWKPKRINSVVYKQSTFIKKVILPEMNLLYGKRTGCRI